MRLLHILSIAALALGALAPSVGRCDTPCAVRVLPKSADAAWLVAARDLDRHLRAKADGAGCAAIDIVVDRGQAELVLVASDGRRVVREIGDPSEVGPTVQALQVSLLPLLPPPAGPPSEPTSMENQDEVRASPLPEPRSFGPAGIVGGSVGARTGGGLITPTITAFGALHGGHWEFGVFAQWELAYQRLRGVDEPEWSSTALGVGLLLGHREAISSSMTLVGGATILGAMTHEETHHVHPQQESTRAAGRLGAYIGLVWPKSSYIRMRSQLGGEISPISGSATDTTANLPAFPFWAATFSIGIEAGEDR
jgi:hypothetical protein